MVSLVTPVVGLLAAPLAVGLAPASGGSGPHGVTGDITDDITGSPAGDVPGERPCAEPSRSPGGAVAAGSERK